MLTLDVYEVSQFMETALLAQLVSMKRHHIEKFNKLHNLLNKGISFTIWFKCCAGEALLYFSLILQIVVLYDYMI